MGSFLTQTTTVTEFWRQQWIALTPLPLQQSTSVFSDSAILRAGTKPTVSFGQDFPFCMVVSDWWGTWVSGTAFSYCHTAPVSEGPSGTRTTQVLVKSSRAIAISRPTSSYASPKKQLLLC